MAKKPSGRTPYKEVGNQNRNHETLPDEIALRDEILQLKRQMMVLRRTNEQYLVKLRKYEDEAKRKDKQVEQLMDPRKNADVTKVLSTKGAAILMNLKDQNNALIQMILNKDLHIRRLVAEIKMSKLYATTRKNECYRAEINRLRNLLVKSQEALKENLDVQQQQERSICTGGNSLLEFSSSSDQSSPRDLDELRVTILSLESHIQHSNDLLVKKNQEISSLTNEVNFLRKCFRYKTYKNKTFDCDTAEYKNNKFSTADFTYKWSKPSTKLPTQNILDLIEKNEEDENLPHSAPAVSSNWFSPIESEATPNCNFQSPITVPRNETRTRENTDSGVIAKTNEDIFEKVSAFGKPFPHKLAGNKLLKEEKTHTRTICTKVKWMKALNKYRELKKLKRQTFTVDGQSERGCEKVEIVNATEFFSGEASEVEMVKNITQPKPLDLLQQLETPDSLSKELSENISSETPNAMQGSAVSNDDSTKACQNSERSSVLNKEEYRETESVWNEAQHIKRGNQDEEPEHFPEKSTYNASYVEDNDRTKTKSLREIYRQSLDSSFDSDSSYSTKQEVRQVEVEVQINSVSHQNDSDQSVNSISENNLIFEYAEENGGNRAPDADFNDDDDVIVRDK